ncbi:hypothetical protein [Brunnivagina elsteri]|uniref:Uncharacterized protein n=1 Tax=Brunnivagina elsteri CCALA 953 TaxID=987040 RepID=A0A2A2TF93_9CYAN|nr:hypothetical protein [Calothrix elsteri]PAX52414.1 hypothetical protein CK510_19420 [Calothrix elsteri CCALA 953]
MLPIKTLVIGGAVASLIIGFILHNTHSATAQKPKPSTGLPVCQTWKNVKSEIQMIYMGSINNSVIPDMPKDFQNGCVYGDFGAYTISFYVFKNGWKSTNIKPETETVLDSSIARIDAANPNVDKQIKNGNILHLFNVCSSSKTVNFCKGIPKDNAYTKDNLVCLRNLCIQASNIPEKELLQLWNTVKSNIPNVPQKSGF